MRLIRHTLVNIGHMSKMRQRGNTNDSQHDDVEMRGYVKSLCSRDVAANQIMSNQEDIQVSGEG